MELAQGNVGDVGHYDVKFENGKLVAKLDVKQGVIEGDMSIKLDAGLVMDAIAKAIPGQIDDAIIGVIKAALINA